MSIKRNEKKRLSNYQTLHLTFLTYSMCRGGGGRGGGLIGFIIIIIGIDIINSLSQRIFHFLNISMHIFVIC